MGAAVLGTLLLGVVANALNLFSVSPFWQPAITGLVILVAVGLDSYQRKRAGSHLNHGTGAPGWTRRGEVKRRIG